MMDPKVIDFWWVTLGAAVMLTPPLLGIVARFIRHAREIDRLATVTLKAAAGVAGNTANIVLLDQLLARAGSIAATSSAIDGVAAAIHSDATLVVKDLTGGARRGG